MDPHLRALRCFVAVAEEQHFTRAAARLHLTQPALSKHIRALESLVRTPLFTRGRHGARLTAAGTALLPHAQQLLTAWDTGQAALEQAVQAEHRQLVIGLRSSVGRGLLRRAAELFQQQHPTWRMRTRQHSFADPFAGLLPTPDQSKTDVALLWLPLPAHDALTIQVPPSPGGGPLRSPPDASAGWTGSCPYRSAGVVNPFESRCWAALGARPTTQHSGVAAHV